VSIRIFHIVLFTESHTRTTDKAGNACHINFCTQAGRVVIATDTS
jgi:hypothetical protein